MTKYTRQGVRDLNHLKSTPSGKKLEEPPIPVDCKHKRISKNNPACDDHCLDCGCFWDYEGNEY